MKINVETPDVKEIQKDAILDYMDAIIGIWKKAMKSPKIVKTYGEGTLKLMKTVEKEVEKL